LRDRSKRGIPMTLHLRESCKLLAALSVSNGFQNVAIKNIFEVDRGYDSADCPIAVVLPSDDDAPGEYTPIALDSSGMIVWSIPVLYLDAPVEEGQGWMQHARSVAAFAENFVQAIIDAKALFCANNTMMIGLTARRGVYSYPAGSGIRFYGVMFTVRVKDFSRTS